MAPKKRGRPASKDPSQDALWQRACRARKVKKEEANKEERAKSFAEAAAKDQGWKSEDKFEWETERLKELHEILCMPDEPEEEAFRERLEKRWLELYWLYLRSKTSHRAL
eukprot:gene10305-4724_t